MTLQMEFLFAFFFANFSFITPPVALAALFSSQIAKASYIKTSIEAMKVGIGGFVLPFMIALYPLMMWEETESVFAIAGAVACLVSLIALQAGFVGYLKTEITFFERGLWIFCGLGLMGYLYTRNFMVFSISIIVIILMCIFHLRKKDAIN